jgi:hypothetical protein
VDSIAYPIRSSRFEVFHLVEKSTDAVWRRRFFELLGSLGKSLKRPSLIAQWPETDLIPRTGAGGSAEHDFRKDQDETQETP